MRFGDARGIALEGIGIGLIYFGHARGDIRAIGFDRARHGMYFFGRAEQTEFRIRRRFEFIVGVDGGGGGMVDGDQLDLIEIGNFVQLFGDVQFVVAVFAP